MVTNVEDSDMWFHFLGGDPFAHSVYCGSAPENNNYYNLEYVKEGYFTSESATIENDEIIAHALQEELSQLAVAEATGSPCAGEERLQASILAQDWLGSSTKIINPGSEDCEEVVVEEEEEEEEDEDEDEDEESSSLYSSPGEKSYDDEEWTGSLDIMDEFSVLDGEVGKRLNQMVPIPHVPRINGEIPSVDEATSDHQRLLDRLRIHDLIELKVLGDGNCQFRALSDQFYRTTEHHKFVRQEVINQLRSQPQIYEGYVPMVYADYLKKLSKAGEWGDHVTLQAASDSYGIKILVITSFKDTCYIEIMPTIQKSKRVIFLSFWAEVHYNSIYPQGDVPTLEAKKKRWRLFGNSQ